MEGTLEPYNTCSPLFLFSSFPFVLLSSCPLVHLSSCPHLLSSCPLVLLSSCPLCPLVLLSSFLLSSCPLLPLVLLSSCFLLSLSSCPLVLLSSFPLSLFPSFLFPFFRFPFSLFFFPFSLSLPLLFSGLLLPDFKRNTPFLSHNHSCCGSARRHLLNTVFSSFEPAAREAELMRVATDLSLAERLLEGLQGEVRTLSVAHAQRVARVEVRRTQRASLEASRTQVQRENWKLLHHNEALLEQTEAANSRCVALQDACGSLSDRLGDVTRSTVASRVRTAFISVETPLRGRLRSHGAWATFFSLDILPLPSLRACASPWHGIQAQSDEMQRRLEEKRRELTERRALRSTLGAPQKLLEERSLAGLQESEAAPALQAEAARARVRQCELAVVLPRSLSPIRVLFPLSRSPVSFLFFLSLSFSPSLPSERGHFGRVHVSTPAWLEGGQP